jgi:non-specific serine/threonine protein kinase
MKYELGISPDGRLFVFESSREEAVELSTGLREAFTAGTGRGLLALLREHAAAMPAVFRYFIDFGRELIGAICHCPESESLESLEATGVDWTFRVLSAPPMPGGEYLSAELLTQVRRELLSEIVTELNSFGGTRTEWVRALNPAWAQVGKVSFHLAENKQDRSGERPFAFLATFIHKLSASDRPKHLPLGEALKAYAADRNALLSVLKPIQQAAEGSEFLKGLLDGKTIYAPQAWSVREAYRFLQDIPVFEEAGVLVRIANIWKNSKPSKAKLSITIDAEEGGKVGIGAMMRCAAVFTVDGKPLSDEEIQAILNSHDGLVKLKGEWVEADSGKISQLMEVWGRAEDAMMSGFSFMDSLRMLSGIQKQASFAHMPELYRNYCHVQPGGRLKQMLDELSSPGSIPLPPLPERLGSILRPYQLDGVKYLWRVTELGMGGCLADDMGLGKTLQLLTLAALWKKRGDTERAPILLVLPASLLKNWQNEAAKFTPELRFRILHPMALAPEEKELLKDDPEMLCARADLVATTYGMLKTVPRLKELHWTAVVADEAQALKNPASQQSRAVRALKSLRRLALTGTPIENGLTDLWSIFDFIQPGLLGNLAQYGEFVKGLKNPEGVTDYTPLRQLTRPFILRRLKTDRRIIQDLPDKTELTAYCALVKPQVMLYQRAVQSLALELKEAEDIQRKGLVLKYLMAFKQICNHPAQFSGNGDYDPALGGKFNRLGEIASEIAAKQEKMLIFTQFRELSEPLHEYLAGCFGRPGLILHGGTPLKQRQRFVEQFQEPGGAPYFVLSLKAAGTGLNLTAANHVVHFDRWWNPAVENQATDRAFRIGQHRNVLVHKFVCKGTIEEKIDTLINSKRDLAENLLSEGTEKLLTEMSDEELLNFVALDVNSI